MIKHHRPLVIPAELVEGPPLPRDVPRIQVDLVQTTRTEVTHLHRRPHPFASLAVKLVTAFWLVPVILVSVRILTMLAMGEPLLTTLFIGAFSIAFFSACWMVSLCALWLYRKTTE